VGLAGCVSSAVYLEPLACTGPMALVITAVRGRPGLRFDTLGFDSDSAEEGTRGRVRTGGLAPTAGPWRRRADGGVCLPVNRVVCLEPLLALLPAISRVQSLPS
jgi:hypothetical protein